MHWETAFDGPQDSFTSRAHRVTEHAAAALRALAHEASRSEEAVPA